MEKLELKHVQHYPLGEGGIEMLTSLNQGVHRTIITQIDFTEDDILYGDSYLDINDGYYPYKLDKCHLILRPLSDLEKWGEYIKIPLSNLEFYKINYLIDGRIEINSIPHSLFEKLLMKHFDVFGLIEKGLAIDINSIDKQ